MYSNIEAAYKYSNAIETKIYRVTKKKQSKQGSRTQIFTWKWFVNCKI